MSDNLNDRGQQDRSRISHWTEALGVSREQLERAVRDVGPSVSAVREHLGRH